MAKKWFFCIDYQVVIADVDDESGSALAAEIHGWYIANYNLNANIFDFSIAHAERMENYP